MLGMGIQLPGNAYAGVLTPIGARKFSTEANNKNWHTCESSTVLGPASIKIAPSLCAAEAGARLRE